MTSNNFPLPGSGRLPVNDFSRLFKNTTNSYKYLFLLAVLRITGKRNLLNNDSHIISLSEITEEMLIIAWYPHVLFRLSFGSQDKIAEIIDETGSVNENYGTNIPHESIIRKHFSSCRINWNLMRFVPYRLIRPFFEDKLRGLPDNAVNSRIKQYSRELFESIKPLYMITDNEESVIIHPEWFAYLRDHYTIIESWILWNWMSYMQVRNPNTPNIGSKLLPPEGRSSLSKQRGLWRYVIDKSGSRLTCPYSEKPLSVDNFALDHVLPWSFVAHDQLWNLVPCSPEVNSSKSDNVPHSDYIFEIADKHCFFLTAEKRSANIKKWDEIMAEYCIALRLSDKSDIADSKKLHEAYRNVYFPLFELASSQGFKGSWKYRNG